jgi:hypothetical protein
MFGISHSRSCLLVLGVWVLDYLHFKQPDFRRSFCGGTVRHGTANIRCIPNLPCLPTQIG